MPAHTTKPPGLEDHEAALIAKAEYFKVLRFDGAPDLKSQQCSTIVEARRLAASWGKGDLGRPIIFAYVDGRPVAIR